MYTASEKAYIDLCKKLIAENLQLGETSGKLRSRDLEYLAQIIEERSGIKLSISTLKRIWKKGYDQRPHPATLNALVSVLDYDDWQEFRQAQTGQPAIDTGAPVRNYTPVVLPFLLVSVLIFWLVRNNGGQKLSDLVAAGHSVSVDGPVLFTADKMESVGVPNSVIFNYDVSHIRADSFFIQQSWNPRNKIRIDPEKHHLSTIYYAPGFHFARLMANDSIIQFLPVHIRSEGWLPFVKYDLRDPVPMYLPADQVEQNGQLQVTESILKDAGVDPGREFYLRYYMIEDFGGVDFANSRIRTRVRADSLHNTVCPLIELMVVTEANIAYVQLMPKGCVANLQLMIGDHYRSAVDNDLSAFGLDVYQWQDLELKIIDQHATVLLNDEAIYEQSFERNFGRVVGVILTFKGAGAVDGLLVESSEVNQQVSAQEVAGE
ncbi:MAG: hypothetical protein R2824_23425 [Saprospiraceae bacterium]